MTTTVRRLLAGVVTLVLCGGAIGLFAAHRSGATSRPLIVTAAVTRRTLEDKVTLTGTLGRPVQRTVVAGSAGVVSDVAVKDGQTVGAGQSIIGFNGREMVAEPGAFPFYRPLGIGDSGPDVKQLDTILASSGYDPGGIGTVFTAQTQAALERWQAAHAYPGLSTDKPQTMTVSIAPSGAYKIGPQGTAGLVIGSSAPHAGVSSRVTEERPEVLLAAAIIPTLTIYAVNPVTAKGMPALYMVYSSAQVTAPVTFSVTETGNAPADEVLPPAGPFTIPAGASSVEVQVPTRTNGIVEPDAQLSLQLDTGSGYVVGDPAIATTTVQSADVPELNLVGGGTVPAGAQASFTVVADHAPLRDTSVALQVSGTGQPGEDFVPLNSIVVLPAGHTSVSVSLQTLDRNVSFQPTDMLAGAWPIRVGQVSVKAGDSVAPGGTLFTLTDSSFTVTLSATPSDRTQLSVGQAVTVEIQGGSSEASGVISQLDANVSVDPTTKAQTYSGKVSVKGALGAADGAAVTIDVTVRAADNVLTVPIAAVKQDGLGQDVVRVIDMARAGRVSEVPVRTGLSDSSYIEIDSGLREGQVVIVETDTITR